MEFDRYAEQYDKGLMGKGSARFYRDLIRALEVRDGDAVLDVGCGTGSVLSMIGRSRKISGFGLDVSENMIALAREKNPDFAFTTGDSAALPYADGSMDIVMACMAYHHFPERAGFRKEAWRVLKEGGSLYICDPRFPGAVRWILNTCFQEAEFCTPDQNIRTFEGDGFRLANTVKDAYVQVLRFEKQG